MNLNIDLVKKKISDFPFIDVKLISDFHLKMFEENFEKKAILDIEFVIESNGSNYKAIVRFHDPQEIKFEFGWNFHHIDLDIMDISDWKWENIKLKVMEYEDDRLHFYYSKAEILDISGTSYSL